MGHGVGQGGVCPVCAKVQAIDEYAPPSTKRNLWGSWDYWSIIVVFVFIFFWTVVAPLGDVLKATAEYVWSSFCQVHECESSSMSCARSSCASIESGIYSLNARFVGAGAVP